MNRPNMFSILLRSSVEGEVVNARSRSCGSTLAGMTGCDGSPLRGLLDEAVGVVTLVAEKLLRPLRFSRDSFNAGALVVAHSGPSLKRSANELTSDTVDRLTCILVFKPPRVRPDTLGRTRPFLEAPALC